MLERLAFCTFLQGRGFGVNSWDWRAMGDRHLDQRLQAAGVLYRRTPGCHRSPVRAGGNDDRIKVFERSGMDGLVEGLRIAAMQGD